MRVAPNGDVFVAETRAGRIRVLRAADGGSKPVTNEIYASGLKQPFGIAFFPSGDKAMGLCRQYRQCRSLSHRPGDIKAPEKPEIVV